MKVLFVCMANINRSQIAEAIFNGLSKRDYAFSAGVKPSRAGVLVRNEHNNPSELMRAKGYDLSRARVKKLNKRAADSAGKVVLILGRKHLKDVPTYVRNRPDMELWEVGSINDDAPFQEYRRLERRRIKQLETRVRDLVKRLEEPQ